MAFHINEKGEPGACQAQVRCPFGGSDEHYATMNEARAAYETRHGSFNKAPRSADEVRERLDRATAAITVAVQAINADRARDGEASAASKAQYYQATQEVNATLEEDAARVQSTYPTLTSDDVDEVQIEMRNLRNDRRDFDSLYLDERERQACHMLTAARSLTQMQSSTVTVVQTSGRVAAIKDRQVPGTVAVETAGKTIRVSLLDAYGGEVKTHITSAGRDVDETNDRVFRAFINVTREARDYSR